MGTLSSTGEHQDQAKQTGAAPAIILLLIVAVLVGWIVT